MRLQSPNSIEIALSWDLHSNRKYNVFPPKLLPLLKVNHGAAFHFTVPKLYYSLYLNSPSVYEKSHKINWRIFNLLLFKRLEDLKNHLNVNIFFHYGSIPNTSQNFMIYVDSLSEILRSEDVIDPLGNVNFESVENRISKLLEMNCVAILCSSNIVLNQLNFLSQGQLKSKLHLIKMPIALCQKRKNSSNSFLFHLPKEGDINFEHLYPGFLREVSGSVKSNVRIQITIPRVKPNVEYLKQLNLSDSEIDCLNSIQIHWLGNVDDEDIFDRLRVRVDTLVDLCFSFCSHIISRASLEGMFPILLNTPYAQENLKNLAGYSFLQYDTESLYIKDNDNKVAFLSDGLVSRSIESFEMGMNEILTKRKMTYRSFKSSVKNIEMAASTHEYRGLLKAVNRKLNCFFSKTIENAPVNMIRRYEVEMSEVNIRLLLRNQLLLDLGVIQVFLKGDFFSSYGIFEEDMNLLLRKLRRRSSIFFLRLRNMLLATWIILAPVSLLRTTSLAQTYRQSTLKHTFRQILRTIMFGWKY